MDYTTAPWHRASVERMLHDALPALLAARIPLTDYAAEFTGDATAAVRFTVRGSEGDAAMGFDALPVPDRSGAFHIGRRKVVLLPTASTDDLRTAAIACAGEQIIAFLSERLAEASSDFAWDSERLREWAPLDRWIHEFLIDHGQRLDDTNWLSQRTHLRRILLPKDSRIAGPGQQGFTCAIETPENPTIGRVLNVAAGAHISDGWIEILDPSAEAGYGLGARMVPMLEHSDPARLLMGVNMMRQWLTPPEPEPALVRTGFEPDDPAFWCGRNLLTAFISRGSDTFEDALLVSESAAARLAYPEALEPGDKLSNRHGSKGIVCRIAPDDEMPHLPDGRAVDLVYDGMGLFSRMNFGVVREAVLGLASEGATVIAPPFRAPSGPEIAQRLRSAGLPEDGRLRLRDGADGPLLDRPSTVGIVYWGKLVHRAATRFSISMGASAASGAPRRQGLLEYYALRECGATANIIDQFHTRARERAGASDLANAIAAGSVPPAEPPSRQLQALARRLGAAGIAVTFENDAVTFSLRPVSGERVVLAEPMRHPWLTDRPLTEIGALPELPEFAAVVRANDRLERARRSALPASGRESIQRALQSAVDRLFAVLVRPSDLQLNARPLISVQAIAAPAADLAHDRIGIPEETAWSLFAPLLARTLPADAIAARSDTASRALDRLMERSWVLAHRAPVNDPACIIAFRPGRTAGRVIRLHPLANTVMNADFDGDQLALFLPITEAAQQEAGERLTLAAHLARSPQLITSMQPLMAARYGLALLARTPQGFAEIERIAGIAPSREEGPFGKQSLIALGRRLLRRDGAARALDVMDALLRRGREIAATSGFSIPALLEPVAGLPPMPAPLTAESYALWRDSALDHLASIREDETDVLWPFAYAATTGARGTLLHVLRFAGAVGPMEDADGQIHYINRSLAGGLTAQELAIAAVGARRGQARAVRDIEHCARLFWEQYRPSGFSVLSRAMRSDHPGPILARAAANRETDPLTSLDARLFVGLNAEA